MSAHDTCQFILLVQRRSHLTRCKDDRVNSCSIHASTRTSFKTNAKQSRKHKPAGNLMRSIAGSTDSLVKLLSSSAGRNTSLAKPDPATQSTQHGVTDGMQSPAYHEGLGSVRSTKRSPQVVRKNENLLDGISDALPTKLYQFYWIAVLDTIHNEVGTCS
eukprot:3862506-Pleurochrysis_carterae.AAC.1